MSNIVHMQMSSIKYGTLAGAKSNNSIEYFKKASSYKKQY